MVDELIIACTHNVNCCLSESNSLVGAIPNLPMLLYYFSTRNMNRLAITP